MRDYTLLAQVDGSPFLFLLVPIILAVVGFFIFLSYKMERERREALARLAGSLGLRFSPDKDRSLARRYSSLDELRKGSNRYAYNVLRGQLEGNPVELFDYHYQITRSNGKSSTTHHYYLSVLVCLLPKRFPELRIYREGVFEKLIQFVGFEDIHFESAEFSRRYTVRSRDRKFAFDFVHARTIDHLLNAPDLNIEVEGDALAIVTQKRLSPEELPGYINHLTTLRRLMPDYLFAADGARR